MFNVSSEHPPSSCQSLAIFMVAMTSSNLPRIHRALRNDQEGSYIDTMASKLTPLKDLKVLQLQIPAHGLTPNTSLQQKPLLIYRSAFPSNTNASQIQTHFSSVGVVKPAWRYTVPAPTNTARRISLMRLRCTTSTTSTRLHTKSWGSPPAKPDCASGMRRTPRAWWRCWRKVT